MGFRFRKSFNLGGGFRINLSKSGVGYSFGGKGFRVTKKATGGTRYTASIPGTGLSWVSETSKKNSPKNEINKHTQQEIENNEYNHVEYNNENVAGVVSTGLEEILNAANKAIKLNKNSTIAIVCFLALGAIISGLAGNVWPMIIVIIPAAWKIYVRKKCLIKMEYNIDPEQRIVIDERMKPLKNAMESEKIWRVNSSNNVIDTKYTGGANFTINRSECSLLKKTPFPFELNEEILSIKCDKETYLFFPDKFLILQNGKIGALNYSDLSMGITSTRFIEEHGTVPSDAKVVGRTWEYVNKSGGPDKRFSNNRELPICLYGELTIRSEDGKVNTKLMFSKYSSVVKNP